jgi:hypothetical protein
MNNDTQLHVDGPVVDETTGVQTYTVMEDGHTVHFSLEEDRSNSVSTWKVSLEGIPDPGIIHREAWTTPEMARDAALRAVHAMLDIEIIRDEAQEEFDPGESDSCADDTGGRN